MLLTWQPAHGCYVPIVENGTLRHIDTEDY